MARGRVTRFTGRSSYKNIVDTEGSLAAGITSTTVIATAVEMGAVDQELNEVVVGGRLSAIYYSVYIYSDALESEDPRIELYWWKNEGGTPAPSAGNTGNSQFKDHILHEEKGLAGNRTTGMPMIVKGVLRIPPKMARFGLSDTLELKIKCIKNGIFCAKHIYRVIY